MYANCSSLLISEMYLLRGLSFVEDLRFNVRSEHVQGCSCRGYGGGLGGYQPGVYLPFKALFLVLKERNTANSRQLIWRQGN